MPAIRTVSNIKANLLRPALTSHFEVELGIPAGVRGNIGTNQDKLNLMCSEASLPGSNLALMDITNDYTGVTERHVHRRVFDESIELTFYVDAGNYLPIRFFEGWIEYITNGRQISERDNPKQLSQGNYFYRMRYPDEYVGSGLKVRKFERDHNGMLEYEFIRSFPRSISSMPVSYDASSLLKCSVQMTYIRYVVQPAAGGFGHLTSSVGPTTPFNQAQFNAGGLSGLLGNVADAAVTNITGNRFLGDLAGAATRIFT